MIAFSLYLRAAIAVEKTVEEPSIYDQAVIEELDFTKIVRKRTDSESNLLVEENNAQDTDIAIMDDYFGRPEDLSHVRG